MNFSEAMFNENYLTSDFHTNTVISRRVCLLAKMAPKTVIRPIPKIAKALNCIYYLFIPKKYSYWIESIKESIYKSSYVFDIGV